MPYIGTCRISLFFEEAGSGGIPVLLLHELGGSSESWREVIPLLATDRRVLAVDRRGVGIAGRCVAGNPSSGNGTPADDVRVAPDMAGPTRAYLAEREEKVRVVGMRGVAEASLANSFPASHPAQRAAYRAIYL